MKHWITRLHDVLARGKIKCLAKTYAPWVPPGTTVLDIGCGNGAISKGVANLLSLSVTGCDRDSYLQHNLPYVPMSREDVIPFGTKSFDTVMFNDVLHHTSKKNQEALLKEAIRVAKRNIVIFEAKPALRTVLFDTLINKIYHPSMPLPLTFRPAQEWQNLFRLFPVECTSIQVLRPFFSPFPRLAFNLKIFGNHLRG